MDIKIGNKTMTSKEWSEFSGVDRRTIECRIKKGMSPTEAVFTQPHGKWEKVDGRKR